jgi:hypothetical protein
MKDLLEVFAIDDALHKFADMDLCSASLALLHAMDYLDQRQCDGENQTIDQFIYLTVPNKVNFSGREMAFLKRIDTASFLCEIRHDDLIGAGNSSDDSIVFLAIDMNSPKQDRSEDAYYISQILRKTYDGFVFLIIKNADNIMLCTCVDGNSVYMSNWYSVQSTYTEVYPLLAACYPNIIGVKSVREFYIELAFSISREYIKYPESYEYITYQYWPLIDSSLEDSFITAQQIKDMAEQNCNYYKDRYGDDYVVSDDSFQVMAREDDEWTLLELDDFVISDIEMEDDKVFDDDEIMEQIDYSKIDKETLDDPVKLLKWIEEREKVTE